MLGRITVRNLLEKLAPSGIFQVLRDTRPCILMYHCVGKGGYDEIAPATLDAHLQWLKEHYDIVTVGEILEPGDRKRVALTFDDGLLSFQSHALPLIERHSVPATVYIIGRTLASRTADDDSRYLSARQVRNLADHPLVTIGSHSMSHLRLGTLDNRDLIRSEVRDAAQLLRDVTGSAVDSFCYPYNSWNEGVRDEVAKVHRHAVCGMGDIQLIDGSTSAFSLPRINAAVSLSRLKFRVADSWKTYNRATVPRI